MQEEKTEEIRKDAKENPTALTVGLRQVKSLLRRSYFYGMHELYYVKEYAIIYIGATMR